ncbi:hypothetical protein EON66_08780, partial [archaeon]
MIDGATYVVATRSEARSSRVHRALPRVPVPHNQGCGWCEPLTCLDYLPASCAQVTVCLQGCQPPHVLVAYSLCTPSYRAAASAPHSAMSSVSASSSDSNLWIAGVVITVGATV